MTINCLVTKNVEFIVAPYEADCQIAKLKRLGMVDAVISEDSDLIAFGVNVILKLNQNGECDYVDLNKWKPKDVTDVFLKYFLAFDELSRIDAAILAGSDYNQSVKGIGIKRAIKLLTTQVTMKNVINKLKYKKTYMSRIP
jgi:exonuclease-1